MLHTISQAETYFDRATLLDLLTPADAILLWQDGVVLGIDRTPLLTFIREKKIPVFALVPDITARGLESIYDKYVQQITLTQCVELTEQYQPQLAW